MSDHNLTCRLDTSNLWKAQTIFLRYGNTVPAYAVNRTALFCIQAAQDATPVTSQSRIDMDMQIQMTPIVSFGSKGKTQMTNTVEKTRAMMIVVSRMHPNSKYSLQTGNRWPVPFPDVVGYTLAGAKIGPKAPTPLERMANQMNFWNYVEQVAERMVSARHSSVAFLKASWTAIIEQLLPNVPPKYRRGFGSVDRGTFSKTLLTSEVTPARTNQPIPICIVSNTIGVNGSTDALEDKYNEAAHRILGPLLKSAIDREYQSKMEYAAAQGWRDEAGTIIQCGWIVK